MDKLLQPQSGLIIWTIVTFVGLLGVLAKFAWKPILGGLTAREQKIKNELDRAEKAQKDAESMRVKFETQLTAAQKTIQDMMTQARQEAERSRIQMLETSKQEAERILEKGRKDLAGETERLKGELQSEVSSLSLAIAEKVLQRSIDPKVQSEVLKDSLTLLTGVKR